jgi:hypothetical protein
MDLRTQLLQAHSKENCDLIVAYIGNNQNRFDDLFELFMGNEKRIVQMSSWPLSYCVEAYPFLIDKKLAALIKNLEKPNQHEAVKRHTTRILQCIEIPKKYHGVVMNICFNYIQDITEKPATKVFSLTVIEKLAKLYPEIKSELYLILESQMQYASVGFKNRAKKLMVNKLLF